jgi:hypothetical protein
VKRPLDPRVPEEEAALFRAAVHDAVPLRAGTRHHHPAPVHPPVPVQSLLDELSIAQPVNSRRWAELLAVRRFVGAPTARVLQIWSRRPCATDTDLRARVKDIVIVEPVWALATFRLKCGEFPL